MKETMKNKHNPLSTPCYSFVIFFLLCAHLLTFPCFFSASGRDVHIVPSEGKTTIMSAVEAAKDGDLVLVKPGVYKENVVVALKSLEVKSVAGPFETVIDGGMKGSVFSFKGVTGKRLVLEGFTLINGSGTLQMLNKKAGGGLYLKKGIVQIRGNIIVGNKASMGAGIYVNSDGDISDNTIAMNVGVVTGGGLYTEKNQLDLYNNYVIGNFLAKNGGGYAIVTTQKEVNICDSVFVENWSFYGGGVNAFDSSPLIENNVFLSNRGCRGGGILARNKNASPIIRNNILALGWSCFGGGVCCHMGATPLITGNVIFKNTTYNPYCTEAPNSKPELDTPDDLNIPDFSGGGIFCWTGSKPVVVNNFIYDNIARMRGGGIGCNGSVAVIGNNTLVRNWARWGPGGIYVHENTKAEIFNTIVWNNEGIGGQVSEGQEVTFSDVEGGYEGTGNMEVDPSLVNGECDCYHLHHDSPLKGMGCTHEHHGHNPDIDGDAQWDEKDIGADEIVPFLVMKEPAEASQASFEIINKEIVSDECAVLGVMSLQAKPFPGVSQPLAAHFLECVREWTRELPRWHKTEHWNGKKLVPAERLLSFITDKNRSQQTEVLLPIQIERCLPDPFHPRFLVWVCGPALEEDVKIPDLPNLLGLGVVCMLNERYNRFMFQ